MPTAIYTPDTKVSFLGGKEKKSSHVKQRQRSGWKLTLQDYIEGIKTDERLTAEPPTSLLPPPPAAFFKDPGRLD